MLNVSDITKVAVIGAGEMGHGIAQVFAQAGFYVALMDKFPEALEKAKERIQASLQKQVAKARISQEDASKAFSMISFTSEMKEAASHCQLAIEAVPEKIELKKSVFSELDSLAPPQAILASNTSNIRITELANSTKRPERVAGLHFFNPATTMKLVEIIPGEKTSKEVLQLLEDVCRKIGKAPVRVLKDSPGFIVNRINAADVLLLSIILDKGIASPAEVDAFAKGQGMPMGPYELLDFVGLDVAYDSLKYFAEAVSPDYARFETIKKMVEEGRLGRKTGRGFYEWVEGRAQIPQVQATDKISLMDIFAVEINEAVKLIEEGVATPQDIEQAVIMGMNRPFGPVSVAKSYTSSEVSAKLEELANRFECKVFSPARSIREGKLREAIEGRIQTPQAEKEEVQAKLEEKKEQPSDLLILEKIGDGVARISLNRGSHNFINSELLDALNSACSELEEDRETRVVILTGKGKDLSAGADISQYFASPVDFVEFSRKGQEVMKRIASLPQLTIAVVKGNTIGGGLELALACDIRIAEQNSTIGFTEVTLGLIPGWSGTQRLVKLLGLAKASQLILTGSKISGKEAFELGLVNTLVQEGDVDEFSVGMAKELSWKLAPVSVRLAKRLLKMASETSYEDGLSAEAMAMGVLFGTEDLKEGISAFFQKRKPTYKGR